MQHPPPTVFDRPQWPLRPDLKGVRVYGNASNRLEIGGGRRTYAVALAIPTDLFTYLREVVKAPQDSEVTLGMDLVDGYYVFSVLVAAETDNLIDLWSYKESALPTWMSQSAYRVR